MMMMDASQQPGGAIVVVAKCPIPNKSKTRLIPLLGEEGSAKFAKAMLSDVLVSLSTCSHLDNVLKVLLYAPGNAAGLTIMMQLLEELDLHDLWVLLPVSCATDLVSSGIGDMLADALERTRALLANHHSTGSIVFVGMDSPELPLDEIVNSLLNPSIAYMCPANDGGYGMLSVPPQAPSRVFENVIWSQSLTAVSQLKALTDLNIPIKLGRLMYDMDEREDVQGLAERQCIIQNAGKTVESLNNNLMKSSGDSTLPLTTGACHRTWSILQSLGLIVQENGMSMVRTGGFCRE